MSNGNRNEKYKPNYISAKIDAGLARGLFHLLSKFEVEGEENFPKSGPLIMVGNHFSFLDPPAFISVAPWPMEFIGGAVNTARAKDRSDLSRKYGDTCPYIAELAQPIALKEAQRILNNGGIIGIFPEGGAWAEVLRPARPGAALLTANADAPILPIGLDNFPALFPVTAKIQTRDSESKDWQTIWPFQIIRQPL